MGRKSAWPKHPRIFSEFDASKENISLKLDICFYALKPHWIQPGLLFKGFLVTEHESSTFCLSVSLLAIKLKKVIDRFGLNFQYVRNGTRNNILGFILHVAHIHPPTSGAIVWNAKLLEIYKTLYLSNIY